MADRFHPSPLTDLTTGRLDRRSFLRGAAVMGGAVLLHACGVDGQGSSGGTDGAGAGTVTLGSNYSDQVPRDALATVTEQFEQSAGTTVDVNTVDHNTYQEQINNYLQANPGDVFAWFAGYRMQFFAERGLASPIPEVWDEIGDNYSDAFREASTADGQPYFVPFFNYPWAFFYRRSLFEENGYEAPATLDELVSLSEQMQEDGLTPIAFADRDGWPAMGTFDYLNLRINGYDYHTALMAGEESWDSDPVREVFTTWRDLLPYHQEDALGRTWQEAAQTVAEKQSGMYLLGLFVGQQFQGEAGDDLDFFPFPEVNPEFGIDTVEAPIDGWMMSAEPENPEAARELLIYLGSAEAQEMYLTEDPNWVAANNAASVEGYTELQNKSVELINEADHITQFLDRDTRPDFASSVIIPSLQRFLREPDNVDSMLTSVEEQKQSIFGS